MSMIRYFFCFVLSLVVFLWSSIVKAEPVGDVVEFLSWEKVKSVTDGANYVNVELDGFIQFEGESSYPVVTLWESTEAMKYKRPFMSVAVDSESLSPMLLDAGQTPAVRWKSLNGKYVRIRGVLKDQKRGFDYIDLGRFLKIFDITITLEDGKEVCYSMNKESAGSKKGTAPEGTNRGHRK